MAIVYKEDVAYFKGVCEVEEAEELLDWIKLKNTPKIDVSEMEHIHTAIAQIVLFFKPEIIGLDKNSFFGKYIFSS
ncbi:MAG: hypothetical protein Q9M37_10615 [Desulfonauticus sp.]|nr:hypothetical protein [Desulfonauticus sp.]